MVLVCHHMMVAFYCCQYRPIGYNSCAPGPASAVRAKLNFHFLIYLFMYFTAVCAAHPSWSSSSAPGPASAVRAEVFLFVYFQADCLNCSLSQLCSRSELATVKPYLTMAIDTIEGRYHLES